MQPYDLLQATSVPRFLSLGTAGMCRMPDSWPGRPSRTVAHLNIEHYRKLLTQEMGEAFWRRKEAKLASLTGPRGSATFTNCKIGGRETCEG